MKNLVLTLSILFLLSLAFINNLSAAENKSIEENKSYAGSEICASCHAGIYNAFLKSVHGKKVIPDSPANKQECESCHGPGSDHVFKPGRGKEIFAFNRTATEKDRSSKCLSCHEESKSLAFWDMSRHRSAGVPCDDCHSIHYATEKYLKTAEPALCFGCHKDIRSLSNKRSHHPVIEGLIKCSSCHDPMGGFGMKMIKADSTNELCYTCHSEKRGPFMWEHPPVDENCLNCHDAHGSSHSGLLSTKVPTLCQSCHDVLDHNVPLTSFHAFGGSAASDKNRFFGRSCLNCHSNIHGGDGPVNPISQGNRFVR